MVGSESAGELTGQLKRLDPAWWWLRENFKLPSVVTIGGCVLTAAVWIWTQHTDLQLLKSREDPKPALERIEARVGEVLQTQSAMRQQLADFSRRIDVQDRKWERVEDAAEIRVPRKRGGFQR